jgi:iron complex outermembrane receptor protein
MAENIDRDFKGDQAWFADYKNEYQAAIKNGESIENAHKLARENTDFGRPQPSSEKFKSIQEKLQNINNWDIGAALRVKARFVHSEMQYNLTNSILAALKNIGFDIAIGADRRTHFITPDGNYFINPLPEKSNRDILYSKTGAYIYVNKKFFNDNFIVGTSLRLDKNDYFKVKPNPRINLQYLPSKISSVSVSFQQAYRFPSIFEAYSNINSGGVKRVGGLPIMSNGVFENGWLVTSISDFQSAVRNDINKNGLSQNEAIIKNKELLKKCPYTYVQPENIKSFEFTYKAKTVNEKINYNLNYYYTIYSSFIAQTNINVPNTTNADSIPFSLYDKSKQAQYRVWTNSKSKVYNYGFSGEVSYSINKDLHTSLNFTYAKLKNAENKDGLEDGFNTPSFMANISLSKKTIFKNIDGGFNYKWQTKYYWQSFLVSGEVPSFGTLDMHFIYQYPNSKFSFKVSGTNVLNKYYYSYLGGPNIGEVYMITVKYQ